ncbi:MAG: PHP domain-containing protein [Solirubrobacterales bacterium]
MKDNREIADLFLQTADMLAIEGWDASREMAFRKAAWSIYRLEEDIEAYWRANRLQEIPGIGPGISRHIDEIFRTGSLPFYQELRHKVPAGLVEMLAIPGLGPKTIGTIYKHTGISTPGQLLKAARDHRIRSLPGIGVRTEFKIIKGMEMRRNTANQISLADVIGLAYDFCAFLRGSRAVILTEVSGGIRRRCPLVSKIDLVVASDFTDDVLQRVEAYPEVRRAEVRGRTVVGRIGFGFPFEIVVVPLKDYALALLLSTGGKQHIAVIKERLQAAAVTEGDSEEALYRKIGLEWIEPELREDRGEIEAAETGRLPRLVALTDIKGDLHCHTDWSDGVSNLEELSRTAKRLGYAYLAITDHSQRLQVSNGLDETRLLRQMDEIERINASGQDVRLLAGIEVDILKNGTLDLPDRILETLDVVVASIHSSFQLSLEEQTTRLVRAMENPNVDIIGHLTGRLLLRRPGYEVDLERILGSAAATGTILEINSHPDRLDIDETTARRAKNAGVRIAVDSDAHGAEELRMIAYGLSTARRGWLSAEDLVNTRSLVELQTMLRA